VETYQTRDAARQEVFDDIGMFDPPKRKHTNNGMLSPVDYEIKQQRMDEAGVWEGTSLILSLTVSVIFLLCRNLHVFHQDQ
tara:strand:- start:5419 stop:5661 length:243 start_codon:yes stop_codon:yes gene_type:complete